MAREKQTKENTFQTSIRLPISLYTEIEEQAIMSERTVADQIRYMLKKYLELQKNLKQ